jgi:hypothetical protein
LSQETLKTRNLLQQVKQEYENKLKIQNQMKEKYSIPALLEELREATNQVEKESDTLFDNFVENKKDPQKFLKEYMAIRSLYHLRNAKLESIQRSGQNF